MMTMSNHTRRMMKVKVARAPQYNYNAPMGGRPPSPVTSSVPASTAALAGAVTFLGLALFIVLGVYFYRRRYMKAQKNKAPSAAFDFNRYAFTEKKNVYSLDQHVTANITNQMFDTKTPRYIGGSTSSNSGESRTILAWKPQTNTQFRVTNDVERSSTSMPAVPKAVAEKGRAPRSKPPRLHSLLNPDDLVSSPPPSYDIASGGQEFVLPIPAQVPREKSKAIPSPPTPPANRKSYAFTSSKKANAQKIVVPSSTKDVSPPITSPTRSSSLAYRKLRTPPISAPSKVALNLGSSNNLFSTGVVVNSNTDTKPPKKLMNVVVPYTPTLSDELHVQVGDTVRVLQEYQDGWCFAQFVGRADTPKGVLPLVCLEERKRMVPVAHNTSNNSMSSSNNQWR